MDPSVEIRIDQKWSCNYNEEDLLKLLMVLLQDDTLIDGVVSTWKMLEVSYFIKPTQTWPT